jgi:hypothetical protein
MARTVYVINRGVNAPIVFKGLQGQYIGYLGGGLAGLLMLFVILYLTGVNTWICLIIVLSGGGYLFHWAYTTNKQFGVHGVMKKSARKLLPRQVRHYSRRVFCKCVQ